MERTIPNLLAEATDAAGDTAWLYFEDDVFTFGGARRRIATAAAGLADLGAGRGDLVLVPMRNTAGHLFTWLGLMHLGAILVAVNPAASEGEVAGLVAQTEPRLVLGDTDVEHLLAAGDADPPATPGPGPDDPAVLIPTSGTTGRSKLVTQTHRAYVMAGEGFPWWMELTADDRLMTSLPLFHINAPAYSVLGSVAARAGLVLLPRFSPSSFLDSARRYGATEFNAIGAMIEMIMRRPERPDDADTPLRLAYTGPAPTEARQLEIERRLGLRLVCGYALSESPYGTIWPRNSGKAGTRPYGTLGAIRQHPTLGRVNEGRVMRHDAPVPPGEVGELELRNPAVMLGYWGMPEETARVIRPDGWLRTGDLVVANPDGTYTFVGREKEVIRRRGENLAPAEVEEALASHPHVVEVAVVGVPSELTEEEVKAFVVPATGASPDPGALHAWAAGRLTRYKVPRYIELVAALPHTPTGRVAKHQLPKDRNPREWDAEAGEGGLVADDWLRTGIGRSTPDAITVRGRDLATELMGRVSFGEMAFLLTAARMPSPGETRLFDAALVALADHGLTPSVLAARLTWTGATESLQGSVAAGLLGAGNVFLGVVEDTARFLAAILAEGDADGAADRAVETALAAGRRIPGLGHPVHKVEDPRTAPLYAIAAEAEIPTPHMAMLRTVAEASAAATGKALPINGAGAAGAAWADLGFRPEIVRGFALLARTAGLIGHLAEEMADPIGLRLWLDVEHRATYTAES